MKFVFSGIVFLLIQLAPVLSQFSEDFSSGHLDAWQGDKVNFIINGGQQLQLNSPSGSASSWLYAPVTYTDSMIWDIYIKMDFAPSTSNQLRLYLGSSSTDLATASGYYLEIGASGDQDPLELKFLNNGTGESLATSAPGFAGTEPVELYIRVTRKSSGIWQCFSTKNTVPELLFTTTHDLMPLTSLSYFGMHCRYTDTRRDKFFFDDISIQPIQQDITPPQCISLTVIDANSVELVFDELLDESSVMEAGHYTLSPGNLSPDEITIDQTNIILHWNQPFVSQQEYTLTTQEIEDQAGNAMLPDQKSFVYIEIKKGQPFDLLITEILADPTPAIGLPDAEYIEIYNATEDVFSLSDFSIQIGTSERSLPDELIQGNEWIIVCDEDEADLYTGFGRVVAISNFPALTNSGAIVTLKDLDDVVIHEVQYSTSWYDDPGKSDGGWALEMINPLHVCSAMENWAEANNLIGGTPGTINSRWALTPDEEGPVFLSLYSLAPDKILLRFDESLDPLLMDNPMAYQILPSINITTIVNSEPTSVELTLEQSLQPEIIYQLLPFDAFDCLGNARNSGDTIVFGLTSTPEEGDLIINEILFNPGTGGSRFIELLNVSQKFINLNSLAIGSVYGAENDIYAIEVDAIINPGDLVVFSPYPSDILFRYEVPQPDKLFESSLPSWDDETDNVSVLAAGEIIDSLTYFSSWHLPILADQNGVSLERVSSLSSSTSSSNWHSASSVSGYATPTGLNSQNINSMIEGESPYTVTNTQFSPNEDGYKDFLALNFLLDSGEEVGSVWIYDLEGREIIRLVSNESLGTSSIVQWDGRNADHVLADMGIYIIFIQLWDAMGNVREYQETCALVKR
jgi:hypothetical protein